MGPEERIIIRACEIVGFSEAYLYDDHLPPFDSEGRGKAYVHQRFDWNGTRSATCLSADCTVSGVGYFGVALTAFEDTVDVHLRVRNVMSVAMGPIDWSFCVIAFECPSVGDPELRRTFIFDGRRLRSLRELSGAAVCELFPVAGAGGFLPAAFQALPRGNLVSQASFIVVESQSGLHSVALAFDQAYLNYSNPANMCIHADPMLGTLERRDHESWADGKLYIVEGDATTALQRYQTDFQRRH